MVEFVHSFWSKPLFNNKFNDLKTSLAITMVDYALSVEYVHKNGYKIKLYTDREGFAIFKYIPYDEIIVLDNKITDNYHFAASFKFLALEHMGLNDVLIDGDIFLKKSKIYDIIENDKSDILVSFFEPKTYIDTDKEKNILINNNLKQFNFEVPYETIDYSEYDGWYNTSLMKFNNQELKNEYVEQYKKHLDILNDFNFGNTWPDIVIEQRHLTQLCRAKNYNIKVIAENFPDEKTNKKCIDIGFTHLGTMKVNAHNDMVKELYNLNPKLCILLNNYLDKLIENK